MKTTRIISALLAILMMLSCGITSVSSAEDALPFTDVKEGEWYFDAVAYTYAAGLMNGTGDGTKFSPMMNLTRGMVVTVLYRNDGAPAGIYSDAFADINGDEYYATAASWAYDSNVVTGTGYDEWGDPIFSADRNITRQELAAMFARYAAYCHVDTAKNTTSLDSFSDAGKVASWAEKEFKWTAGTGIITGKKNGSTATLSPTDLATRAEFAIMIQRYNTASFEYLIAYETPKIMSTYTEIPYAPVDDADIYVAVDGLDTNPGTKDKPLATLDGARKKVRELKKTAKDGIVVAFKAGNYGSLDNVQFTADDSGSESIPVTYCKYGDGDVIFSNGSILHADDFVPISDTEAAMFPAGSVNMIKKLSFKGILPGELKASNYLFSEVDGLIWLARDLNKNSLGQDYYYSNLVTEASDRTQSIKLLGTLADKVKKFSKIDGMMFKGMLLTGYTFNRFEAKYFDPETNELFVYTERDEDLMPDMPEGNLKEHGGFAKAGRMDTKIFFYNLPEFMDMQGEYWIDRETETLYVYNPVGRYTFCTDGTMITLNEGADHIRFIGLEFNGCADTMIHSNADYTTYDRCVFANIGGHYAIRGEGVNHFTFINSDVHNFVDGGVFIISDADRSNIISAENVFRNNIFHDFGLSEYWSQALRVNDDVGCIIEHNEFRDGAHGAVRYGNCLDTIIQYNVFDSMMKTTQDYGAVYCIGNTMYRDNIVRYNLFMNITGTVAQIGAAAYGFYVDDYSCGQQIYGNIFFNGGIHAVTLHDGRDNDVHDNVIINTVSEYKGDFVMTTPGLNQYIDENGEISGNYQGAKFYRYLQNLPKEGDEGYELWRERWPLMFNYHYDPARIDELECGFKMINYIRNNYTFGAELADHDRFDNVSEGNVEFGLDENPIFVNPAVGDYRIRQDADFHSIPYEKMGRY